MMHEGPNFSLWQGDCLPFLRSLPDKSVDHVVADPPYEAEAHANRVRATGGNAASGNGFKPASFDTLIFDGMDDAFREAVSLEMVRVSRRWIIVFCQVEAVRDWARAIEISGGRYRRGGVWVKPDGMPQFSGDRPGMGFECLTICDANEVGRSRWNGGGRHGVWTFPKIGAEDRVRTGHQTQKPVALMEALVRDFTDPGETILDPFAGSGTTGVAAIRLGRKFIGCEISPKYHSVAVKRLSQAREQLRMFEGTGT